MYVQKDGQDDKYLQCVHEKNKITKHETFIQLSQPSLNPSDR